MWPRAVASMPIRAQVDLTDMAAGRREAEKREDGRGQSCHHYTPGPAPETGHVRQPPQALDDAPRERSQRHDHAAEDTLKDRSARNERGCQRGGKEEKAEEEARGREAGTRNISPDPGLAACRPA